MKLPLGPPRECDSRGACGASGACSDGAASLGAGHLMITKEKRPIRTLFLRDHAWTAGYVGQEAGGAEATRAAGWLGSARAVVQVAEHLVRGGLRGGDARGDADAVVGGAG